MDDARHAETDRLWTAYQRAREQARVSPSVETITERDAAQAAWMASLFGGPEGMPF